MQLRPCGRCRRLPALASPRPIAIAVPLAEAAAAARPATAAAVARVAAPAATGRAPILGRLAGQHGAPREADLAGALLDADHHHIDLVAHLDHILDVLDTLRVQLGDMHHTVLAGDEVDERAERHDSDNLAEEHIADLDLARERLDHRDRLLGRLAVGRGDEHAAVVLDVDL